MLDEHTAEVETYEELAKRVGANAGWSLVRWCGNAACEARIKAETKATIRCIPRNQSLDPGACIVCGGSSDRRVIVARAY
jgi:prolyl-tRNA synthetase